MWYLINQQEWVRLDKSTRIALRHQPTSSTYDSCKDMIKSCYYFISTENKVQTEHNFCRTYFRLNYDYMKQFLGTIKAKYDEDAHRRARLAVPRKKEDKDLLINNNSMHINQ